MWATHAIEQLRAGESVVIRPRGHSMVPLIESGRRCMVDPCTVESLEVGDVVLCKVSGRIYFHLVSALKDGRALIANNGGRQNGWTSQIYGKWRRA